MIDPMHLTTLTGLGFVVGFRHAFEPDHLAAVSTLATRPGGLQQALWLGTAWGVGHTLSFGATLLMLAVLDVRLPPTLHSVAELGVAGLLVFLGLTTLWTLFGQPSADGDPAPAPARTTRHSFGFGLIHGLAGSGALVVLLAATATTQAEQLAYFLPFGVGTIGGMLVVSVVTCGLAGLAVRRSGSGVFRLRLAAAALSIVIGCWLGLETTGLV